MDSTRQELESREEGVLAPFALRSGRADRLRPVDPEGRVFDYRTEYQRDRDRILHSRAFRRLRLKSLGGATSPADRGRDGLTHTLEVTQIARTIARALSLNEDLTEAIALGHAVGAPPFGRDGTRVLQEILSTEGRSLPGGFQIHLQSLRVLDLLEKRYEHPGLNLTHDVREGVLKQGTAIEGGRAAERGGAPRPRSSMGSAASTAESREPGSILDGLDLEQLAPGRPASLESQAVAAADRIATTLGDLDDALRAGEIDPAEVERFPIVRELIRKVGERYPARARRRISMKANVIHRGLTHLLVTATIHPSRRALRAWCRSAGVETHDAFLAARAGISPRAIAMGPRTARLFESLRGSLEGRLQATASAALAASKAKEILSGLLEAYHRDPRLLDDYVLLRFKEAAGGPYLRDLPPAALESDLARRYHGSGVFLRVIADHIAGMTDAYALSEFGRVLGVMPPAGGRLPHP